MELLYSIIHPKRKPENATSLAFILSRLHFKFNSAMQIQLLPLQLPDLLHTPAHAAIVNH